MLLYCVSVLRELQCCYKVASLYHIFCRYAAAATATGSGVRAAAEDAAERSDRNRALAIQLLLLFLLLCSRRSIHVACGRGPLDGAAPLLPARALCIHCFECCSARSLLLSLIWSAAALLLCFAPLRSSCVLCPVSRPVCTVYIRMYTHVLYTYVCCTCVSQVLTYRAIACRCRRLLILLLIRKLGRARAGRSCNDRARALCFAELHSEARLASAVRSARTGHLKVNPSPTIDTAASALRTKPPKLITDGSDQWPERALCRLDCRVRDMSTRLSLCIHYRVASS